MLSFLKTNKIPLLFILFSAGFYWSFAYDLERFDFAKLTGLYGVLCFFAYKIIQQLKWNFKFLVGAALVLRLVFIIAIPDLSQDFYRFIWDGRLLLNGINPYLFTPDQLVQNAAPPIAQASQLLKGMGILSAGHYSNYPPINQLFFTLAALLGGKSILGSVIGLRLIIIAADLGILYFGTKLLKKLELSTHRIFWYLLNPFIIIELTGNLHFEGVMLFFVIWALYSLARKRFVLAAVLLGISVSVKLLPLLFLPVLWQYLIKDYKTDQKLPEILQPLLSQQWKKGLLRQFIFFFVALVTVILTFLPFLSTEFIANFMATINLWFQKFEFNASVFYIIRWVGFQVKGWNIIQGVGEVLPFIILGLILLISFFRKNSNLKQLITGMLFAICLYFLGSTTVHPWYVATPLVLCIFTRYRFPLLWGVMVFLSYSAYGENGVDENLWLVALEYVTVIGYAGWEIGKSWKEHGLSGQFRLQDSEF